METPSLPLSVTPSAPDAEGRLAVKQSTQDEFPLRELEALVTQYGCTRTLTMGLGPDKSALAIMAAHQRQGDGRHLAIDAGQQAELQPEGLSRLRDAEFVDRLQLINDPPELALPDLLQRGTELDLAVIAGAEAFEDAFLQFLYIDRMLVTGGILVLDTGARAATEAIVEYLALSRAYEQRSTVGSRLVVLRKLGRHRPTSMPVPDGWSRAVPFGRRSAEARNGAAGRGTLERLPSASPSSIPTSSREVFLLQARVAELEGVIRQLRARLLEAELDSSRELDDLRDQLQAAKSAHEQAEYWLACITSSPSWRLTAPLRLLKRLGRRLAGR